MSRYRTIKPEFWTSEQVVSCSSLARLMFIGLWNFCDDAGIHPGSFLRLKMEVFPADDYSIEDIKKWIWELINASLITEYDVDGEVYWKVTGWEKHQKIEKPTYRHPLPNKNSTTTRRGLGEASESSRRGVVEESSNGRRLVVEESESSRRGLGDRVERSRVEKSRKEKKEIYVEEDEDVIHNPMDNSDIVEQARPVSLEEQVFKIFDHWRTVMKHPGAVLGDNRKRVIRKYLIMKNEKEARDGETHGYSVEQLCNAISGCAATPWNMGENPRGQRYDSLELILRDEGKIDGFIRNYHEPPKAASGSNPNEDLSLKASKAWDKVMRATKNPGFSRTVIFDDKIIHAVISEMAGGWRELGKIPTEKIIFLESKFVKRYLDCVKNPPQSFPERLKGRLEYESSNPYNNVSPESLEPIFIGEVH